jgi:SAM-dependent methyltransferase
MDSGVYEFMTSKLTEQVISGKTIIDIGSRRIKDPGHFSIHDYILKYSPEKLVGVDILSGEDVDVVCPVEKIFEHFSVNSFDIVLMTDVLEHVMNWRLAITYVKQLCKINGIILITVPSYSFPKHEENDFWRFVAADFKYIFSDSEIVDLFDKKNRNFGNNFDGVYLYVKRRSNQLIDLGCYEVRNIN